jgi:hypothetical protein
MLWEMMSGLPALGAVDTQSYVQVTSSIRRWARPVEWCSETSYSLHRRNRIFAKSAKRNGKPYQFSYSES